MQLGMCFIMVILAQGGGYIGRGVRLEAIKQMRKPLSSEKQQRHYDGERQGENGQFQVVFTGQITELMISEDGRWSTGRRG